MIDQKYKYMVATQCLTYNQTPYIEDALNGFVMQETSFPTVYIVVDDASTDGEPDLLRRWAEANLRHEDNGSMWCNQPYGDVAEAPHKENIAATFVILLLKENHYRKGQRTLKYYSSWVNSSKYLAICEGDDYWTHPYKLQRQVEMMESDKQIGAVHTDCASISDNCVKHFINKDKSNNTSIDTLDRDRCIHAYYCGKLIVRTCTAMLSSELLKQIKETDPFLFDGHLKLGDTQMWIGVLLKNRRLVYWNEETAVYRIHKGSASHQTDYKNQLAFAISRYEIRVYYKRKYGILSDFPNVEAKYNNYIRIYRFLYDPCFKDIDGNTRENNLIFRILSKSQLARMILLKMILFKNKIRD